MPRVWPSGTRKLPDATIFHKAGAICDGGGNRDRLTSPARQISSHKSNTLRIDSSPNPLRPSSGIGAPRILALQQMRDQLVAQLQEARQFARTHGVTRPRQL